ncbi:MAG: hypothetical protein P2A85_29150 (plasmid) [Microcoleus anatoxicus]|uniref:hypothetical protein n=1 Tax=Microcoleus anatoxicus TaxID=2705319 RepID=UPI00366C4864
MEIDIKISKNELRKISSEFRMYANRLMQTTPDAGMNNLKRFVNFIDKNLVISDFLRNNHSISDIQPICFDSLKTEYKVPDESQEDEISFTHQLLQYGLQKFYNNDDGYLQLAFVTRDYLGCNKHKEVIDKFNHTIVKPFIYYIENYLTDLQTDLGDGEDAKLIFHVYGNNYGDNLGAIMNEMNIDQSKSSIGVGVNHGEINTEKLAGTINEAEKQNLVEAAAEIRQLLEQLSQTNPPRTTAEKMAVAAEAINRIESDPTWKQRAINAAKGGGLAAFEKAIDNPAGAFVVGAIQGWQEAEAQ